MKDLKFTGTGLDNEVVFRVDSISGEGNMTVMETYGLNDRKPQDTDKVKEKALLSRFQKLNYTLEDFKKFATDNTLTLQISETDNSNSKLLVGMKLVVTAPAQGSSSADTTPTYTGTAIADSDIKVVIDSLTFTTKANSVGVWTLTTSVLATGSKTSVVTATKDGVSATVNRNFTIS